MNITDLKNFNLTEYIKGLNLTIFGWNLSDIDSLKDFNITEYLKNFNLTEYLKGLNLTNLFKKDKSTNTGNNEGTSTVDKSNNGTGFDWSSIFNRKETGDKSLIDSIVDWITGKSENSATSEPAKSGSTPVNSINSADLNTYYDKTTSFQVTVMPGNKPVTSGKVISK